MSDERLRTLQRRAAETGDPHDVFEARREAVRIGRPDLALPLRVGDVVLVEEHDPPGKADCFRIPVPWRGTVIQSGWKGLLSGFHKFEVRPSYPLGHPRLEYCMTAENDFRRCPILEDVVTLLEPAAPSPLVTEAPTTTGTKSCTSG